MKVILNEDVVSVSKGRVYGRAGEEVTIISERGDILIVESCERNRYSVQKSKIKNQDETQNPETTNKDCSGEQVVLRRDNSTRNKSSRKAPANPPVVQQAQKTLW